MGFLGPPSFPRTVVHSRIALTRSPGDTLAGHGDRERFDAVDDRLEADRGQEVERVLSARQFRVDDGIDAGAPRILDERRRAPGRREGVVITVDD
jgi:hypothetical protein